MNSGLKCAVTITGPLIPVEPTQSVNSLDIVPAMLQHMSLRKRYRRYCVYV